MVTQFLAEHGLELALSAVSFLAAIFVSYVREKRLEAENAKLQKDVDRNKELLSRQGGIINAVLSQQQKSQSYTIERQAQAAEQTWKEVLRLRELNSPCISIDSILLPSERHGEILYKIGGLKPGDGTHHAMEYCRNDNLEELRPYLGEELWIKFSPSAHSLVGALSTTTTAFLKTRVLFGRRTMVSGKCSDGSLKAKRR